MPETRWVVIRWPVEPPHDPNVPEANFIEPVIIDEYRDEDSALHYLESCRTIDTPEGKVPPYAYAIRKDIWTEGLR